MADDANGVIYRIAYEGNAPKSTAARAAPAAVMDEQAAKAQGVSLAKDGPETKSNATLVVTSASFKPEGTIPQKHSEYADGVSPARK
jgi:hypothetical protein